jgi:hypothetical protein
MFFRGYNGRIVVPDESWLSASGVCGAFVVCGNARAAEGVERRGITRKALYLLGLMVAVDRTKCDRSLNLPTERVGGMAEPGPFRGQNSWNAMRGMRALGR